MMSRLIFTICIVLGIHSTAFAQANNVCGSPLAQQPVLQPIMASTSFAQNDAAVDCFMWQTFVYLTWPALNGQPGVPDPSAQYGGAGSTVWETYKPHDAVFLPNGQAPAPWNDNSQQRKKLLKLGVKNPLPTLRILSNKTKLFRTLSNTENDALNEIHQVGGGVLYDQNKAPVYYEMLLNETEFNYINNNQLYNANTQYQYAQQTGIVLPSGSIEVKTAWKVLTPQEAGASPVRFHTAQALLPGSKTPVTVGLVGMHVFTMPSNAFNQGFWATFQQIDNAPLADSQTQGTYSFNNPQCSPAQCPTNVQTPAGTPTQVAQVFGATTQAQAVNAYMLNLIQQQTPTAPWQFYQLVSVQWPTSAQSINGPAKLSPLPNGSPNTTTLMNPVLETFLQQGSISCLGCHTNASVATPTNINNPLSYASSYSFLFGHAKSPTALKKRMKK